MRLWKGGLLYGSCIREQRQRIDFLLHKGTSRNCWFRTGFWGSLTPCPNYTRYKIPKKSSLAVHTTCDATARRDRINHITANQKRVWAGSHLKRTALATYGSNQYDLLKRAPLVHCSPITQNKPLHWDTFVTADFYRVDTNYAAFLFKTTQIINWVLYIYVMKGNTGLCGLLNAHCDTLQCFMWCSDSILWLDLCVSMLRGCLYLHTFLRISTSW